MVDMPMHEWYVAMSQIVREIRRLAFDVVERVDAGDASGAQVVKGIVKLEVKKLAELWEQKQKPAGVGGNLVRHASFAERHDFIDILHRDLPEVEERLERVFVAEMSRRGDLGFEHLLHPRVEAAAYEQFRAGQLRNAVLDAFIAVFDFMRERTGLTTDGEALITQTFSVHKPLLVLDETETETGRNDQVGFMQIFQGAYKGIRNTKAHTLEHTLTPQSAARYLIFASQLADRVERAKKS